MPRLSHQRPTIHSRGSGGAGREDLPRVPYAYQGGDATTERDAEVAARVAAAQERARALHEQDNVEMIAEIKDRAVAGIRCDVCGYRLALCCCPGGPRGGPS